LGDGDSSHLGERLTKRGVPFVFYSGFGNTDGACQHAPYVSKPADPEMLVTIVVGLLRGHPIQI
jgi:hypothetical protein